MAVDKAISLYFRVFGTATDLPPLLCLPGYWRNCRDFELLAPHLSHQRRVITPDMRGRGLSSYAQDPLEYAFGVLVEDTWRLLDFLGVERAVVLGTTLGGLMALEMASQRPDRVAGVILNDVGPERIESASQRMAGYANADELSFDEAVDRIRVQNEAFFPGFARPDWERMARRAYRQTPLGTYRRDFDLLTNKASAAMRVERPTFWAEWRGLGAIPAAVLRGELSDYLTEDLALRMALAHSGAQITTVKGRGHPPQLDEAESLNAIGELLIRADAH